MYTRWEEEVKSLTKALKGKYSVGYDDIPECIVKQCIQLVKKPLTHIYNVSLNSGVFPHESKIAKMEIGMIFRFISQYQYYPFFLIIGKVDV